MDRVIDNIRKKNIGGTLTVEKRGNSTYNLTVKNGASEITYIVSEPPEKEFFLLLSSLLPYSAYELEMKKFDEFAFGVSIENVEGKPKRINFSPVAFSFYYMLLKAKEKKENYVTELLKFC